MLYLRTFGGAAIVADDGAPLDGVAGHRRVIALLSILAVAGPGAVSRDRLIGLLWPDGDPARVRHALTQSLYQARKVLGCDDLFDAGADIRLNPARIRTDVQEFRDRIERGDLEGAVALYEGPFLEGFFLNDTAEFEQWVTATRGRKEQKVIDALETLATTAAALGDLPLAVRWRRRIAELKPLSATATTSLMKALAKAGESAAAIQEAESHAATVREQLELDPDDSVQALVKELRRSGPQLRVSPRNMRRVSRETPVVAPSAARSRRWSTWLIAATIVGIIAGTGAFLGNRVSAPKDDSAPPPSLLGHAIVVIPFRTAGADPSLGYLREGMSELLANRFADDSAGQSPDPGAVLAAWHRMTNGASTEAPSALGLELGKRFDASGVVTGSVIGNERHIVLNASLAMVDGSLPPLQAEVEGSPDSLSYLVDRLAARLLLERGGEGDRLGGSLTPSLPALRAFLIGRQANRQGDDAAALTQYERAISFDSTFGLAAFQLALAAAHLNDGEQHDRALALAWSNRNDLNARDLAHLIAFAGPRYPEPSTKSEQIAAWNHAVEAAPDRPDVWFELGEHLYHDGSVVGVDSARVHAAAAFARALELDPRDRIGALPYLILSAARARDTVLLRRYANDESLRRMRGSITSFVRWRLAIARGDSAALHRITDHLPDLDDGNLRLIAMASLQDGVDVGTGRRAAALRMERDASSSIDPVLAQHSFALAAGNATEATALIDVIRQRQPTMDVDLRLPVLDAIYGEGDRAVAERAAAELERSVSARVSGDRARGVQLANLCVLAQWRLAHNQVTGVSEAVATLRSAPLPRTSISLAPNQRTCSMMLDAWSAVVTRSRSAARRVAALDSMTLSGPAVSDAVNYSHILLSRLYEQLGEQDRAFAAIKRHNYMSGWPRYLATAEVAHVRLALAAGDSAASRIMRERYEALRVPNTLVSVPRQRAGRVGSGRRFE